jgi:hypothetical protein
MISVEIEVPVQGVLSRPISPRSGGDGLALKRVDLYDCTSLCY